MNRTTIVATLIGVGAVLASPAAAGSAHAAADPLSDLFGGGYYGGGYYESSGSGVGHGVGVGGLIGIGGIGLDIL
ncbi:hypothetical protein [Streptosporangium roseum]|uniref:BA14K family protein n=1 Tax=Streptosporangium roseum (strain ATCC 12428 / DSM 43021 / JCM 3005 / KCTC 9067 / NCIMB 10171 / NRRL 2505 / NI 9100) TaxID=479432 RepID=D2B6Z5_STRRD|nr:hypothetical protein [Streptosporangium roseum]ACZ87733.1 hypothetical protein Sros_4924 [Streptosporangium roseum DSM 43021]